MPGQLNKNRFAFFLRLSAVLGLALLAVTGIALDGDVTIHDPSTVIQCDGRYWVFGTGRGISVRSSADGITWRREPAIFAQIPESVHAAVPKNNGTDVWAPDVIFLNGQYYLYYAVSSWGSNVSAVGLLTSPTLTPTDPRYHWTDHGVVVQSVEGEQLNAIDPSVMHAPDGTLWISYGSYIGVVQMVQLDPKTGLRIAPKSPVYRLSSSSEASALIAHDGYYYLFVNRGSCCKGKDSSYNIRVGRSRKPSGPYLDRYGVEMIHGGGTLFLASQGGQIGPGHFGLLMQNGLERFSCHFESDAAHNGRSVLDIKPLLWTDDGWPMPGAGTHDGTDQIVSKRSGTVLQIGADATPDAIPVHLGAYLTTDSQKWTLTSAAGGYFKITVVAGGKALEVTGGPAPAPISLDAAPSHDADNQLWAVEQISDGSYRLVSKSSGLALTTVNAGNGAMGLGLAPYKGDDTQKWFLLAP